MSGRVPMSKGMTLFQIESELAGLIQLRSEMRDAGEDVEAIDGQIKIYLEEKLPAKVDGVRAYIRSLQSWIVAAQEERARLAAYQNHLESELSWIQGYVQDAMGVLGKKTLPGLHGSISVQANGGKVGLEIPYPELVPDELCDFGGTIAHEEWAKLLKRAGLPWGWTPYSSEGFRWNRITNNEAIRAELEKPCQVCNAANMAECTECHGTGRKVVPGARLAPRGQHLRIR